MVRYIAENEEEFRTLHEPPPMAYLVLLAGGRASHSFPLRDTIKLGRDKSNAVVVADQKVSRHHASLTPIDDTFIISDQGSANGTYVNGVLISQPTRLKNNDRVTIGDADFLFTTYPPDSQAIQAQLASIPAPPSVSAQKPIPASPILQNNIPVWALVGCMALVIIALLLILAMLFGVFVGRSQATGLMLIMLVSMV